MAKLVKCKTCGNDIAKTADTCPHCGAKNKRSGCGCGVVIVALLIMFAIGSVMNIAKSSNDQPGHNSPPPAQQTPKNQPNPVISNALAYLRKVDDISRIDIDRNDVFISFKNNTLPYDYKLVANAAALNGSRALVAADETPSRCTIWVIPENAPPIVDHAYFYATARKGKLQ